MKLECLYDKSCRLWDVASGRCTATLEGHPGHPGGRCGRPGEGWWAARDAATGGSAAMTAAAVWAAEAGPDDRPAGHNLEDGALCFEATSYNIVPTLGTAVLQCVVAGQEVGFACGVV